MAAVCLCGTAAAAVYSTPVTLEQGYTGKVYLSFWPYGDDPMVDATACYSHMGLLTSESLHDMDIKYWAPGSEAYATTEPKWTRPNSSESWQLEIDNIYDYFGCPEGTDITGISIWFHDGKGVGNAKESHDIKNRPWIVPVHKETTCSYSILCKGENEPTWNGGVLMVWDNGYRTLVTYDYNGSARKIPAYGGQPYLSWFTGSADSQVGFDVISAGGNVIYTEEFGHEVAPTKLTADVCGDKAGKYTITNLQTADEGMNNYTFTWDANPNFSKYYVDLYNEDGWVDGGFVDEPSWSINLSHMTKEGTYRVEISGVDENDYLFAPGAEQSFLFELQNIGQTTVRLQVPTDCTWDPSKGLYYYWWGPDNVLYTKSMDREEGTHWWTATMDVPAPRYQLEFFTELTETEHNKADNNGMWFNTNEVCREVNLQYTTSIDAGITYNEYDSRAVACDAKDHDYRIQSLSTKVEDGTLFLEWKPNKDTADQYYITFYTGSYNYYASATVDKAKAEWILDASDKEVEFTMIEIQPMLNGEFTPFEIVDAFSSTDPVKIVNPYMPTNIQEETGGPVNTYRISWDAYEKAKWYVVTVKDDNYAILYSETLEVGKDIAIMGGRCSIVTDALTVPGTVYVDIQAKDEKNYDRAYAQYDFYVSTVENIGETTFSVIIPPDCCFDVSNGVWFRWGSENDLYTVVKATKSEGTNHYSASFYVNDVKYELQIGNRDSWSAFDIDIVDVPYWLTDASCKQKTFYMEQNVFYSTFDVKYVDIEKTPIEQLEHNYIPQGVVATPHEETGLIDFAIQVESVAPNYAIYLLDAADAIIKSWIKSSEDGVLKDGVLSYTLNPNATKAETVFKVVVQALDGNEDMVSTCAEHTENTYFDLPLNPLFPKGLKVTENEDHTLTVTWEANEDVNYYVVNIQFAALGYSIADWTVRPDQVAPKDGKYSLTTEELWDGNGEYIAFVNSYALDGNWCGEAEEHIIVSDIEGLDEVTIRLLVPSDGNFDVTGGLWLCYWFIGETRDADGRFVPMTESPAGSHWYEAKFDAGSQTTYSYCFTDADNWGATTQNTYDISYQIEKTMCRELEYRVPAWYSKWSTKNVDCEQTNHDFTITSVTTDNSKAGRVTFTIQADQIAPAYELNIRPNGIGADYEYVYNFYTEEDADMTYVFSDETDMKYDYMLVPRNSPNWALCKPYEGMVEVKANSNKPTDLKATLGEDGATVTFEWKTNGTETAYYGIDAFDGTYLNDLNVTDITGESYTHTFYLPGTYAWWLTAYDAEGNILSKVQGAYIYVSAPNLRPSHPDVAVQGKTVTLTWQAPETVPQCLYLVRDYYGDTLAIGHIKGEKGFYRTSFDYNEDRITTCFWQVLSEAKDDVYISDWRYGDEFMVQGSSEEPAPGTRYTLKISAGAGGYVNEAVNGEWAENSKVVIRATALAGWNFTTWSDGDANATRKITMDKDYNLVAMFSTSMSFTLELKAGEHGSVNSGVNGTYNGGTTLMIEATPDEGYVFDHWSDGSTEATREYQIVEDVTLTAYFAVQNKVTLTVKISPNKNYGSVLFDGVAISSNKKSVTPGQTITLTAEAKSGYKFVQYKKGGTELSDEAEYTVTVTEDMTITAVFEEKSQGIESVQNSDIRSQKILIDGQLYILRDGKVYTVQGQRVQ